MPFFRRTVPCLGLGIFRLYPRTITCVFLASAFLASAFLLSGCSTEPIVGQDSSVAADVVSAETAIGDSAISPDSGEISAPDSSGPVDPFACPGGHNCACIQHSDCLSGLCFNLGSGKKRCVEPCDKVRCQGDRICRRVVLGGKGGWMCVPPRVNLCNPCLTSSECGAIGLKDAVCVDYGARGAFCGARCQGDADCGENYACRPVRAIDGGDDLQCVRVDKQGLMADCSCSQAAMDAGAETLCSNAGDGAVNGAGSCPGKRSCSSAGLSACSANTPAAEKCDGADNDCDGRTDEDTCGDGNPCTDDSCDSKLGCINAPNTAPCDADGSVCSHDDRCKAGTCTAGAALTCDDGNPCTKQSCDPKSGCTTSFDNGVGCDADNDACTAGDACTNGSCVAGKTKSCDDKKACTLDACNPKTGKCSNLLVVALSCDDGDPCTHTDLCDAKGGCGGKTVSCDDGNPCTVGVCDKDQGCVANAVADGAGCEDGNRCTSTGTCVSGVCTGAKATVCTSSKTCTASLCDGKTGKCVERQAKVGTLCDDGKKCTSLDACNSAGTCIGGAADCDDGNSCTTDSCDEVKGGCQFAALTGTCDDGDACTLGDTCKTSAGKTTCVASATQVCDDKNICTDDTCDPKTGCKTSFKVNGSPCTDGDACTDKDGCVSGKCAGVKRVALVATIAGESAGFKNGLGTLALLNVPSGLARDSKGVIYLADTENHRIRKIATDGTVSTYVGTALPGQGNGMRTLASLRKPTGVAIDSSGTLYIADRDNHLIRTVSAIGMVSTLAGSNTKVALQGPKGGFADGTGVAAKFNRPSALVFSGGALYVADTGNNRIRKVTLQGVVTTVAGGAAAGFADGKGGLAKFNQPAGLGVGNGGVIYIGDTENHRIRVLATDGTVTTLAGNGTAGFRDGAGVSAQFNQPMNMWVDGLGNLLVADSGNHRIRRVALDGTTSSYVGAGVDDFADGGLGQAKFSSPSAIITDGRGNAWIADRGNHRLRSVKDGPKLCLIDAQP